MFSTPMITPRFGQLTYNDNYTNRSLVISAEIGSNLEPRDTDGTIVVDRDYYLGQTVVSQNNAEIAKMTNNLRRLLLSDYSPKWFFDQLPQVLFRDSQMKVSEIGPFASEMVDLIDRGMLKMKITKTDSDKPVEFIANKAMNMFLNDQNPTEPDIPAFHMQDLLDGKVEKVELTFTPLIDLLRKENNPTDALRQLLGSMPRA